MATQKTLEYVASLATKLQQVLPAANFGGPHVQGLQQDLTKLIKICVKRSKAPIANPELTPDIVVIDEPAVKPRRTREWRPTPPGTFVRGGSRQRTVAYDGTDFEAESIAHAICLILTAKAKPKADGKPQGKLDAEGIAAAIQAAYPENNYGPERVYIDYKKWVDGKFACQRHLAEDDEEAVDLA